MAGCRGAGCSQTSGSDSCQQPRASWHLLFYIGVTLGWLAAAIGWRDRSTGLRCR